ncbi:MAG: hypothetical protein LAO31_17880 [Acidobacteriia bacterium]|nr:hypothetical protein [Terriglobia bacterium]
MNNSQSSKTFLAQTVSLNPLSSRSLTKSGNASGPQGPQIRGWIPLIMLAVLLFPLGMLHAQQDQVAALKQSLGENQRKLRQYQWIETTIVSLKGEEKSRIQKRCSYGPDGKVQKQQISAPPEQPSKGGLKGKIIAKKKEELSDYMKNAVALIHQYLPPDPKRIQSAKDAGKLSITPIGSGSARLQFTDFVKPADSLTINLQGTSIQQVKVATYLESQKDAVTLDASFATLEDGASYTAKTVLLAPEKKIQVVVQNSSYQMVAAASPPPPPTQVQSAAVDPGWPRERVQQGTRLITYEPQVDEWKDFKDLRARMAVSLTPAGGKAVIGALSLSAQTTVNTDDHMVVLSNLQITRTDFPSLDPETAAKMEQMLKTFLPQSYTISLERLVACVPKPESAPAIPVKNDPPRIFVSNGPAILLFIDGEPALGKIKNTTLEFVVNTSWPLFLETQSSRYFLLVDKLWMTAGKLEGPWAAIGKLPGEMSKLAQDPEWKDLKKVIPPPAGSAAAPPKVFYSTVPAEVLLFAGKPVFAKIAGTQLLYATNTDSNLFMDEAAKQYYYLTSGRWFRAGTLEGPWSYASVDLPPDFARIPSNSPASRVLISVPGTDVAKDAVLMAQIPTTMIVNPTAAAAQAKATYDGPPQFKPIEGTSLSYATNTQDKVIRVGDVYYLCLQGIWFMSAAPTGPWKTAESIPKEIYTIPPSSPVYNVTYVTQTTTSDGNVEASHTAGYVGAFIIGTAVGVAIANGTGYYYPPYIYHPPYGYPIYHPYPMPYGAYSYHTATGAYGVAQTAYGPYGSATRAASYNPYTGTYARGASVSTPYGSRSAAQAYNPYTGTYAATRQGSSPTAQWGSSVVSTPYQTAYTQHYSTAQGTVGRAQTSSGGKAVGASTAYGSAGAVKTASGDVYAGKDGNVYKKTDSGWQTYNNSTGSWSSASSNAQQQAKSTQQQRTASGQPTAASAQSTGQQQAKSAQQQRAPTGQPAATSAPSAGQQRTQAAQQQRPATGGQGATRPSSQSGVQRQGGGEQMQGLQKEAQNRQRGAQESQRFQQERSSSGGSRAGGGGGGRRR